MRQGSAPNFCPPVEEGVTLEFVDERGDAVTLEFLGLVLHGERRYGFFFPVSEDEPAGSSGEVVLLEVTELDEDGQPSAFELVEDEGVASEVYADFRQATKDLYDFADGPRGLPGALSGAMRPARHLRARAAGVSGLAEPARRTSAPERVPTALRLHQLGLGDGCKVHDLVVYGLLKAADLLLGLGHGEYAGSCGLDRLHLPFVLCVLHRCPRISASGHDTYASAYI